MKTWRFPEEVAGWLTHNEGRALAELACGRRVLEIGSYKGRSTICIAQTAEVVIALDWGQGDEATGSEYTTPALRANLLEFGITNVCLLECRSEYARAILLPCSRHLVFVDGAHDLESVKIDLELAKYVLVPGGTIAMHDAQFPGVRQAAHDVLDWLICTPGQLVDSLYYRAWWPDSKPDSK
jgi:predicted O-methyltransferase YrrM